VLGGEGSGHIICLDKHTTGDGIVSSLQVLTVLRERSQSLGQCLSSVDLYPQILHNLRLKDKLNQGQITEVKTLGDAAQNRLGPEYRVLIRESGTESLLRIMVEGQRVDIVQAAIQDLTESIGTLIDKT
jgi:phosphoglucosamine mutase